MKSLNYEDFLEEIKLHNPGETEFQQAVAEVAESLIPFINENPKYQEANILNRMIFADRIITFRVNWEDDTGKIRINTGYRVQWNNSIGPYKGGLRFHPTVNLSTLKFLGFEQTLKNSLTGLPMGGAKGGSDFDPKGKSDNEVRRFCQSFMTELYRHIGQFTDIPAGDIGVGAREIGYLYGQYKRIKNEFSGVLTGKKQEFGGSNIRPEATGYGCVYMMENMLQKQEESLEGKKAVISGSGNVAQFACEKIQQLGGRVLTLSDSSGFIFDPDGIDEEKLEFVMELKNVKRGRIKEYAKEFGVEYFEGQKPWNINCDLALPCATQNEIDEQDAKNLIKAGCKGVSEGANMPTTNEGIKVFQNAGILFAPGKAANAGGVAVSGLEMSQNSLRLSWTNEEVDSQLKKIMKNIHENCIEYGKNGQGVDYVKGANIAGFKKVADAMIAYGIN